MPIIVLALPQMTYYLAAAMLQQLGVKTVKLMTNNPEKVSQLEARINVEQLVPPVLRQTLIMKLIFGYQEIEQAIG